MSCRLRYTGTYNVRPEDPSGHPKSDIVSSVGQYGLPSRLYHPDYLYSDGNTGEHYSQSYNATDPRCAQPTRNWHATGTQLARN
jgi:hypothetical protein